MRQYILTGTSGSGKTSIIRALKMTGASIVAEAATDAIVYKQKQGVAEPWKDKNFIDYIMFLQKQRQIDLFDVNSGLYFYDRSPICTYALAMYLNFKPSKKLIQEIERIETYNIYEKNVFFVDNLGFIKNTDVRKISFEESLRFEKFHLDAYEKFGFNCIHIPVMSIVDRVKLILEHIGDSHDVDSGVLKSI